MPKDCSTLTVTDVPGDVGSGFDIEPRHLAAGGVLVVTTTYYLRESGRL